MDWAEVTAFISQFPSVQLCAGAFLLCAGKFLLNFGAFLKSKTIKK